MAMMHPAAHVIQHLQPDTMSDSDVSAKIKNNALAEQFIGKMLAMPSIDYRALMILATMLIEQKMMSMDEAQQFIKSLPPDMQAVRMVLAHLHQVTSYSKTLMTAEQHYRKVSK